jgi:hypothetical protein
MRAKYLIATVMVILTICLALPAQAEISKLLALQGRLTDATGQALNGNFSLTFRIYNASTGGTKLWEETQTLTLSAGVFSVQLGSVKPLNLAFDQPYWVEIIVGSEVFSPRQSLAASAYAFRASQLEGLTVRDAKLGIGTTAPSQKLEVMGNVLINAPSGITATLIGKHQTSLATSQIDLYEAGTGNMNIQTNYSAGAIKFRTAGANNRMIIDSTGNVGINTANPAAKLEVNSTLCLTPSGAPANPKAGMIYFNATNKHFYGYDGTAWKQLDK